MTPERIQEVKDQIQSMTDRELQNTMLLKLTQVHEQQAKSAVDTKRAADSAGKVINFMLFMLLISIIIYLVFLSKNG